MYFIFNNSVKITIIQIYIVISKQLKEENNIF